MGVLTPHVMGLTPPVPCSGIEPPPHHALRLGLIGFWPPPGDTATARQRSSPHQSRRTMSNNDGGSAKPPPSLAHRNTPGGVSPTSHDGGSVVVPARRWDQQHVSNIPCDTQQRNYATRRNVDLVFPYKHECAPAPPAALAVHVPLAVRVVLSCFLQGLPLGLVNPGARATCSPV